MNRTGGIAALEGGSDPTPVNLRRTAVHEAGHAVVAEIFALGCTEVTNAPNRDDGTAGFAISAMGEYSVMQAWERRGIYHRGWRSALRASALVLLAGVAAERELLGLSGAGLGASNDLRRVQWAVAELTPADGSRGITFLRLERAAATLVARHRVAIATLADAIVEHRHLSRELLAGIIERVLARSPAVARHGPGARFTPTDRVLWEVNEQ